MQRPKKADNLMRHPLSAQSMKQLENDPTRSNNPQKVPMTHNDLQRVAREYRITWYDETQLVPAANETLPGLSYQIRILLQGYNDLTRSKKLGERVAITCCYDETHLPSFPLNGTLPAPPPMNGRSSGGKAKDRPSSNPTAEAFLRPRCC